MPAGTTHAKRDQTLGEEIANSVSHGVGLLAALVAIPFLIRAAAERGGNRSIVGASIFATSIVLLYVASTLYHAMPRNKAKRVFRVLDYGGVFLLIAGTYTPFTLGVLRGGWGWSLFGIVWGLAVVGIVFTSLGGVRYLRLTTGAFIGMGWLALVAIRPMWLRMHPAGLAWLFAGGVSYTFGVAFLTAKRMPYAHFIWHLFVLAGTACHFVAVMLYAS